MPSALAALLCSLFILYLFWTDRRQNQHVSGALWVPLIWMFFAGSRYLSQWIEPRTVRSTEIYLEGSPLDQALWLVLLAAALAILFKRRVKWGRWIIENPWIVLYFLFGALSFAWSGYPFVSFKRWIKALGNIAMAMVIVTDERQAESIGAVLRRLAFILIPLSILFVKYYPSLGRMYNRWTGEPMFTGATDGKNSLGQACLFSGLYFCWSALHGREQQLRIGWPVRFRAELVFLPMIAWLLIKADSATSVACLVLGVALLVLCRTPPIARKPGRVLLLGAVTATAFAVLQASVDLGAVVAGLLGRDPTLTTRVPMWHGLLGMAEDPLIGVGYESFWLGDRLRILWEHYGHLNQAHNGYLETYLNVGGVGLFLLIMGLLAALFKVRRELAAATPIATLKLCLLVVVAFYNWTEASFHGINNLWLLFFVSAIDVQGQRTVSAQRTARPMPRSPRILARRTA